MTRKLGFAALVILVLSANVFSQENENDKLQIFYKSVAAEKIGNYDDAINILSKNYGKAKNDYNYNLRLGWLYYLKGDYKNSAFYYKNAIRISEGSIESLLGITYPYAGSGNTDKLKEIYKQILKKDDLHYQANLNLALIYFNETDYLNAINYLEKIQKEYPGDYTANLYLGWANYYVGGTKKAHEYFERALMALPNDASAQKGYDATK
jgi:tetratricopeptide (TPR) repeat protein